MSDDAVMKMELEMDSTGVEDSQNRSNQKKIKDNIKERLMDRKVDFSQFFTDFALNNWVEKLSTSTKQQWVDAVANWLNLTTPNSINLKTLEGAAITAYESCLQDGLFEAFVPSTVQFPRLASITQGLTGQYFGAFDINAFSKRINDTFKWHVEGHKEYVSPSFALVQSSGMGKTKLMKQFKNTMMQDESMQVKKTEVIMLLCSEVDGILPDDFKEHFNACLEVPRVHDDNQESQNKAKAIINNQLQGFVSDSNADRVVFLVDEAQLLTREAKGGLYASMRWWLRRTRQKPIVAVFAGTVLSLTNYQHVGPPLGWTRDANVPYLNYNADGDDASNNRKPYDPFFTITTMAMEHAIKKNNPGLFDIRNPTVKAPEKDALFDIRRCGSFGRPMFASLLRYDDNNVMALNLDPTNVTPAKNGYAAQIKNDILHNALTRILLSPPAAWGDENESLASVLATRVQMGLSTYEFAERATSHGYATLVGFRSSGSTYGSASIVFPPDPVCSSLAMGLMRESWSLSTVSGEGSTITGMSPKSWVNAAENMFDHGLFLPNRGDAGEVFAALYMLLVGDDLRAKEDTCMRKFEIDLAEWLESLGNGSADAADSNKKLKPSDETGATIPTRKSPRIAQLNSQMVDDDDQMDCSETLEGTFTYKLNFIQVCRNYFRTHAWFQQGALEFMYATASGCYAFMNCPALDIVFAIRVLHGNQVKYHPVLVSVKCWDAIGGGDMQKALDDMKEYLEDYRNEEDDKTKALCLLIVIGAQSTGALPKAKGSFPSEDAFVPIVVPADDKFGVNEAIVKRAASSAQAEILASHPYAHVEDPRYIALRSKARADDRAFGEALLTEKQSLGENSLSVSAN